MKVLGGWKPVAGGRWCLRLTSIWWEHNGNEDCHHL